MAPNGAEAPLVEVRDLLVVRGTMRVLEIDSLAIEAGETLVVVGPNGAGKSTLLLALASLIEAQRGRLMFRGSPVASGDLAYRRRLGLVLPDPLLLDTSVFANVAAGLRFRGVPPAEVRSRVADWLGRFGVAHLIGRPARQLSSGEAQRVSLARALVLEPDLLLLDEPFASVDAATRSRLIDDFEHLMRTARVTCVFVTHDLDEAVRLGDRMAVVISGTLRQCDVPSRVLAAPVDEDVAAFVGAETRIEGSVVSVEEGLTLVDVRGIWLEAVSPVEAGSPVEAASPVEVGRAVLFCLRPEDVTLWSPDGTGVAPGRMGASTAGGGAGEHAEPRGPIASSARNRLRGRVGRLVWQGPLVRVDLDCGVPLVASITRASAVEMGLVEGSEVVASFKASAVHLIPLPG